MINRSEDFVLSGGGVSRLPFAESAPRRRAAGKRHGGRLAGAAVAALIVGAAVPSVLLAAPAHADASATVKTKTQRMSDANLGSQQNGWYNAGDHVTLVCSRRGQAVKGFFSFNIPNGGWDNLWYQTSDGNYVADVDIETGTLNDVAGECGGGPAPASAPPAATSKAEAAVMKANSMVGGDQFGPVGCGTFVAAAYGVPGIGQNTARLFFDQLNSQGAIQQGAAPRGALVFSQSSYDIDKSTGQHMGHIDIAQGDGTFVSGGVAPRVRGLAGAGHYQQVLSSPNPSPDAEVLGWAYAPW